MATTNPFDLLGDDDSEDPSLLVAAQQPKVVAPAKAATPQDSNQAAAQPAKSAKLPFKPLPPAQAVRESRNETGRGGGRGGGRGFGRGRGGGGYNRDGDSANNENTFVTSNGFSGGGGNRPSEYSDGKPIERHGYGGPRGAFRGGGRGGFSNGDAADGERPRRTYERRSGTGRGSEFKRDGAGRGNWGTATDEVAPEGEEPAVENEGAAVDAEKQPREVEAVDANKESPEKEAEKEEEPEDKEMTLEEYEKVLEEKRKALLALKTSEQRKVDADKEFGSMQPLSSKKSNDEIFIKLGAEKDKRKEIADKEEKAKKSVSINEFLKPAEGERHYGSGGRGRGRGGRGGSRGGGYGGGGGYGYASNVSAPAIEDPGQFPSLGAK